MYAANPALLPGWIPVAGIIGFSGHYSFLFKD